MLKIDHEINENYHLLSIKGEVDASSSIELDQSISNIQKIDRPLLVDCQKLDYISSAGLGVFMSHTRAYTEKKSSIILFSLSNKVKNVFSILGLDQLLTIVKDKNQAEKELK